MRLGIVGSEGAKFSDQARARCQEEIEFLLWANQATGVVSGGCHLGGVDLWAAEIGLRMGLEVQEFLPKERNWEGYKARNILIAENSDEVICLTVSSLPPGFREGGWERYCYHCGTDEHIKSGGCWTTKHARKLGKPGRTIVINQEGK
jgi:hypothetical protein